MVERDDEAHRAVLKASGKRHRRQGQRQRHHHRLGDAAPDEAGTEVTIATDLSITGKVAQFGRSAMNDISNKLLGQFVDCLESRVLSGGEAPTAPSASDAAGEPDPVVDVTDPVGDGPVAAAGPGSPVETAPSPSAGGVPAGTAATGGGAPPPGTRRIDAPEAEPIDLLDAAGAPLAKKLAFPVAAVMAIFFALSWRRRRKE